MFSTRRNTNFNDILIKSHLKTLPNPAISGRKIPNYWEPCTKTNYAICSSICKGKITSKNTNTCTYAKKNKPCRVGLVVSVSASHTFSREFASRPGYTKDHHKNGTNCLPAGHACVRVGVWQCSPTVKKAG